MKQPLTSRQRNIFDFIDSYIKENGHSPVYEVIANHFGLNSLATIAKHVATLIEKGWLKKKFNQQQSLEVIREVPDSRFVFEGQHHLWDRVEECYWIRERDR